MREWRDFRRSDYYVVVSIIQTSIIQNDSRGQCAHRTRTVVLFRFLTKYKKLATQYTKYVYVSDELDYDRITLSYQILRILS